MSAPKTPPARLKSASVSAVATVPVSHKAVTAPSSSDKAKGRTQTPAPQKAQKVAPKASDQPDGSRQKVLELANEAERSDVDAALGYLLDPKNALLTTEIDNPMAITVLELYGEDCKDDIPEVSALIESLVEKFKINMIPYQRKRVTEATAMADAASGRRADRERSRISKTLWGDFQQ